jgi:16S rRNA (cytosine967-C5)-methyltransferase
VSASPARVLAFRVLQDVERGGGTLGERLAAADAEALPPRERAFLHELVLGTLRRRGALDHALTPLLDRPLQKVQPAVRAALRLGAHQILHLRVPDRAAVAESVELVRAENPRATGFANAVLRRLAREGPPPFPDPATSTLAWLTSEGSLPEWLARRWTRELGAARAVARARAHLEPPPLSFRFNPRVPDAPARAAEAGLLWTPGAVPEAQRATSGPLVPLQRQGLLYVQDEGSQLVARLASGPGLRLDACAAPGGKSLLMADVGGQAARIVAAERSARRLAALTAVTASWGATNVALLGADGLRPPFREPFDGVLVDAPCSGLGTLGRHPDLRWRAAEADLAGHARTQGALLDALAPSVARDGLLVYSVCSSEPEETTGVLGPFLSRHPEMEPWPLPSWAAPFADGAQARVHPERHGTDGFFAATLRRRG